MYAKASTLTIEWYLLVPIFILATVSLVTLYSVDPLFFRSQLLYYIVGLAAFLLISSIDYKSFSYLTKPLYFASLILLLIVLVVGIESRGAVRWVEFFGISIQFSEIVKPFLALSFAGFLASSSSTSLRHFSLSGILLVPVAIFIALQPDLGTALIYCITLVFVLLTFGFPLLWFLIGVTPLILLTPIFWQLLHDYQKQRLLSFLHPSSDPLGTTYNVMQAIIAVGSGRILGKGLSESTQSSLRFLPERQTDFIFATISEGFGFLGAGLVIVAFAFLLFRVYKIFLETDDDFGKVYVITVFFFLLVQFFVNIGMNIGIIPVVGVTLPFVSFGGSSILSSFMMLGVVASVASKTKTRVLEIK